MWIIWLLLFGFDFMSAYALVLFMKENQNDEFSSRLNNYLICCMHLFCADWIGQRQWMFHVKSGMK